MREVVKSRKRKQKKQSGTWVLPTVITLIVLVVLGGVAGGIYLVVRRHRAADPNGPASGQQTNEGPRAETIKPPPVPPQPQVTVFPQTKGKDPFNPSPKLRQMIADIDRADPTWRLADIEARRVNIADERNGAILLYGAARLTPTGWKDNPGELLPLGQIPPLRADQPNQVAATRRKMPELASALAAARKLRTYPQGRSRLEYKLNVLDTVVPHLQDLASVRSVLGYDALLQAIDGNGEGALESCLGLLHGCRYTVEEPLLISQQVRTAVYLVDLFLIERVLTAKKGPSEKLLLEVQTLLMEEGNRPMLYEALRGERGSFHYLMSNVANGDVTVPGLTWDGDDHAWYLDFMNKAMSAVLEKPPNQSAKVGELNTIALSAPARVKALIPDVVKLYQSSMTCSARLRAAAVGIAVERYRLKNGRWPANLNALVPEYISALPTHPANGQELRFAVLPEGAAVYFNPSMNEVKDVGGFERINDLNDRGDQGFRLLAEKLRR
jgi:hypothetical protein